MHIELLHVSASNGHLQVAIYTYFIQYFKIIYTQFIQSEYVAISRKLINYTIHYIPLICTTHTCAWYEILQSQAYISTLFLFVYFSRVAII